jgi:hypothetical protein
MGYKHKNNYLSAITNKTCWIHQEMLVRAK